jgi:hypothetical protein
MAASFGRRAGGPRSLSRPLAELAIVGGASLAAIFWLIPAETVPGENFGLSPRMVPIVCSALIGGLAAVNFLAALLGAARRETAISTRGLPEVAALVAATLAGGAIVHWVDLVAGGTVLALLASLAVGERRPLRLTLVTASAALILFVVEWLGL